MLLGRAARAALGFFIVVAFTACGGTSSSGWPATSSVLPQSRPSNVSGKYIDHVVILIQENRSYDNLFARFPGGDGAKQGLTHTGQSVELTKANLYTSVGGANA